MRYSVIAVTMLITLALGCAGNVADNPTTPAASPTRITEGGSSHCLWGIWSFVADPHAGSLEVIPLRGASFHANVLPFLEPPAGVRLSISNLSFNGTVCDVDVSLIHPFPGLSQYTGFDVAGILITGGNWIGFEDERLIAAGPGDSRLLNADGLIRWWNPTEFPQNGTILRYKDGLLGNPYSSAHYNCTLNAYKLFADDLEPEAGILGLGATNRVVFRHGHANTRHYTIDFSGGIVFNYAVDASWEPPEGQAPFDVEDFPPEANRAEAWAISVTEIENTLWFDGSEGGGGLLLEIDAWDHHNAHLNTVWADCPGVFDKVPGTSPTGGGPGYSTYQIDIESATPHGSTVDILIGIESDESGYWGLLPGEPHTGYFIYTAAVGSESLVLTVPNGGEEWTAGEEQDITWTSQCDADFVDLYYSKDGFVSDINTIIMGAPNTGSYTWIVPNDPSDTVKVRIEESGGGLQDDSDDYFTILEEMCDFGDVGFELDQYYSYVPGCHPWRGILVTRQDPVQRIIARSSDGNHINIYNAANPMTGPVASYDTGDLIYCNNDQAMWVDSITVDGIDRIAYNNFGSGSPTPGYGLKLIDWDGSDFSNPQDLGKADGRPLYHLCFTDEGDMITYNGNGTFYRWDKSNGYSCSLEFTMIPGTIPSIGLGVLREMVYDPELDALLLFITDRDVSDGGQLYALSLESEKLFEDTEVFEVDPGNYLAFRVGIDIDLADPDCRVVLYSGETNESNEYLAWHFARYSADLDEKVTYEYGASYYGPCRGDLQSDGTLWATCNQMQSRIYKFAAPPDW